MKYKDELIRSMNWLGEKEDTIFIGQAVAFSGHAISGTLNDVPIHKRHELPVMEEMQMGMSTGLALGGYVPITIYPRFDFFVLCINQFINHLDKMREMSKGEKKPRVITRVSIGSKTPLDAGVQHTQNHTKAIQSMVTEIDVVVLEEPEQIFTEFQYAYERPDSRSTIMIEYGEYYGTK